MHELQLVSITKQVQDLFPFQLECIVVVSIVRRPVQVHRWPWSPLVLVGAHPAGSEVVGARLCWGFPDTVWAVASGGMPE